MSVFLIGSLLFLGAAILAVPLAQRFGLGSVLGYLVAGVALAPALSSLGIDAVEVQHAAEFGVVLMLFLIGLELQPRKLWDMRGQLLGLGGLQVSLSALVFAGAGFALGLAWQTALAVGLILALSSTAIVLQTLAERGETRSDGGSASFAVLLFQDVAVIPIIALLPLLAVAAPHTSVDAHGGATGVLATLPPWAEGAATIGAVLLVVVAGRFGVRPMLRLVASARLRESLTAAALFLVIGIAALMMMVGLSPALGAFLAGVVLADSEYRVELEANIEPFKGLLMGAFFVAVGAGIDFRLLMAAPLDTAALVAGILLAKAAVLFGVASLFGLRGADRLLVALGLAQAGEFAFVLIGLATPAGVLSTDLAASLTLAVAISMLVTPLLFILQSALARRMGPQADTREADTIDVTGRAIIAGIGRFGQIVERLLRASGHQSVVIDFSPEQIRVMSRFGYKGYYGDASRPDLLHAAGLEHAAVLVVAIDEQDTAIRMVSYAKSVNGACRVIARARDRTHYYRLRAAGADIVIRETAGSAYEAGEATLKALGESTARAARMRKAFSDHDQRALEDLYQIWSDDAELSENPSYINRVRALREELETLLREDAELSGTAVPPEAASDKGEA